MLMTWEVAKKPTREERMKELLREWADCHDEMDINKVAAEAIEIAQQIKWCPYEAMFQCSYQHDCRTCDYMLRWQMRQAKNREGR